MKKGTRKCVVCGKEYEFCPTCAESADEPTWKLMFDDANCREIYNISTAYLQGKTTKEEAVKAYNKVDLSMRNDIETDFLQQALNECLPVEETKAKEATETEEVKEEDKTANSNQKVFNNNYKKNKRK